MQGPAVFAGKNDTLQNPYFSIKKPSNWPYREFSNTPEAVNTGFGPINDIELLPYEFSYVFLAGDYGKIFEKIRDDGAPLVSFSQNTNYPIKNASLESFVKYNIDNLGIRNITSQRYTTVGNEKAVRIDEWPNFGNFKGIFYFLIHDNQPYQISYISNIKYYEKYLPEFEQMVKSFRFTGSRLSEIEKSENENITGTRTNFTGVNLNRGYLGIVGVALSPDLSQQIGLNQTKGFLITSITEGSPAEKSDLQAGSTTKIFNGREINTGGDIVLKIDNREVTKIDDIMLHLSEKHPGDKVHLTFLRDNAIKRLDVTLEEAPSQTTSQNNINDSNYPEELYDECVSAAGKSFCDLLFKK